MRIDRTGAVFGRTQKNDGDLVAIVLYQSLNLNPDALEMILASSRETSLKNTILSTRPNSGNSIGKSTSSSASLRSMNE